MEIKLELYKIFTQVYESKSISEAAKRLYISQSAVSQAIKQMEKSAGVQLFLRTQKGTEPTAEGRLLYEYASSALALIDAAQQKLEAMKSVEYGELKLAASDTISQHLLLPVLQEFSRRYPNIKLQIVNRTSLEGAALLKSGAVDLAFVNMPLIDTSLTVTPFVEIEDIFVASSEQGLENRCLTLKELSQMPLILLERKANSRLYIETFFEKKGIRISPEIELGSHELLLAFAKIGLGISCVIKEFSLEYLTRGDLIQLKTTVSIPKRSIGVAHLDGVSPSNAAKRFLEILAER